MKKLFSLLPAAALSLLMLPALANAQEEKPTAPVEAARRLNQLKEQLGLTPEQVEKIKPLFEADREKTAAVRADSTLSDEQKREKLRELAQASSKALTAHLTPEQVTKLEALRAERAKRRSERTGNN